MHVEFSRWEESLYHNNPPRNQYRTKEGTHYKIDRSDFGSYRPVFSQHSLYSRVNPQGIYTVLNVGIGLGYECKPVMSAYLNLFDKQNFRYIGTNLNTPPQFENPFEHLPEGQFTYISGFDMHKPDGLKEESADMFLASRVAEWSDRPKIWMDNLYRILKPGGLAILHTDTSFPLSGLEVTLQEAAMDAGFRTGYAETLPYNDSFRNIQKTLLYKKSTGGSQDFPEWVRDHNFVSEAALIRDF